MDHDGKRPSKTGSEEAPAHDPQHDGIVRRASSMIPKDGNTFDSVPFLPVADLATWRYKRKTSIQASLPHYDLLASLKERDHVFLVDDSASMQRYWDALIDLVGNLAYLVKPFDLDGIDLYFTVSGAHHRAKNTTTLSHHLRMTRPTGISKIEDSLSKILEPHLKRASRASAGLSRLFERRSPRPLSIYVLTDGMWSQDSDPNSLLSSISHQLQSFNVAPRNVGIQFIQFGNDSSGAERLRFLDDNFSSPNCSVDTEYSDGNVLKMLLGSFDQAFDSAPYSSIPNELQGERVEEVESDLEDDAISEIFSNVSKGSAASATSNESDYKRQNAYNAFQEVMTDDPSFGALLYKASHQSLVVRSEFENRLRILLIEFAEDLDAVSNKLPAGIKPLIVGFIKRSSKKLSKDLAGRFFGSENMSTTSPHMLKVKADNRNYEEERLLQWLAELDREKKPSTDYPTPPMVQKSSLSHEPSPVSYPTTEIGEKGPTGGIDSDEEKDSSSSEDEDYPPVALTGDVLTTFLTENHAFENLVTNLGRYLARHSYDWHSIDMQWRRELLCVAPSSLRRVKLSDIQFLNTERSGILDQVQMRLEEFTGLSWNWDPFTPPVYPVPPGKVRIKWVCSCGRLLRADVLQNLALKLGKFLKDNTKAKDTSNPLGMTTSVPTFGTPGPSNAAQNPPLQPSQSSPTSALQPNPPVPVKTAGGGSSNTQPTTSIGSQLQTPQQISRTYPTFVLLGVDRGGKIRPTQLNVIHYKSDDEFFSALKSNYIKLRGFWHYWFHPEELDHCSFSKFERYYVRSLSWKCNELPDGVEYEYTRQLPLKPYVAPISPEEWRHRFQGIDTGVRLEALPLIPQRVRSFQLSTHVRREDFWGLNIEYRLCLKVVLVWHLVFTAGGWIFVGWWLKEHPGDLQNAVVPISLILGVLIVFWSLLDRRFSQRREFRKA